MRSYPLRPLWQQIALLALYAIGLLILAACCVLTLVAFSPAWGVR